MKRLAWPLWIVALAGVAGVAVLDILDRAHITSFDGWQPPGIAIAVSFSTLGAVIVSRRPENRIGWIYLWLGAAMPLQPLGIVYYRHSVVSGVAGGAWAAWTSAWTSSLVFPTGLSLFAFLVFPGGRLPSPRWRRVAWAAVALTAAGVVIPALDPAPIDVGYGLPKASNPVGVAALRNVGEGPIGTTLFVAGLLLMAAVIVNLVLRSRRALSPEREQLKLLAYSAFVTIAAVVVIVAVSLSGQNVSNDVWDVPILLGFGVAVPVACGLAILRHGLYEIDRLISRTVSYTIVTGVLVGLFAGLVLLTTRVLPISSPVGVAASTLAAAALFTPLRRRVQRAVDRRFNRARYNAEATLAAFTHGLRNAVDLETVETGLTGVVADAFQPTHAGVWRRSG